MDGAQGECRHACPGQEYARYGHFHPLVPFAHALTEAGHEIALAAPATLATAVAHTRFRHVPAGFVGDISDVYPRLPTLRVPERVAFMGREIFAGLWPREKIPALLALATTRPPDLIVRAEQEYGGCVAAEVLKIPHAAVGVNAIGDFIPHHHIAAPLDALRATYALPPDPPLSMPHRYLTLRPFPAGFQFPTLPAAPTTH